MGAFLVRPWWGAVGMVGVLLAACYTLRMVQGVLWGACKGGSNPRIFATVKRRCLSRLRSWYCGQDFIRRRS
ncbi:hypothetical protein [Syntrophotalea acetylenica]|uniref:hypothetical protein n=1 Tax=Syntrophotalea acetylenica TaxID=29542 RepID=UPI00090AA3D2|nr:hypothetical protein [Syntrophotalea acetylenica]APG45171.1 hypothetical protein A6070_14395 [Syntrophotalea acetylenica]